MENKGDLFKVYHANFKDLAFTEKNTRLESYREKNSDLASNCNNCWKEEVYVIQDSNAICSIQKTKRAPKPVFSLLAGMLL